MHASNLSAGPPSLKEQTTPSSSDALKHQKESRTATRTFVALTLGTAGMACLLALLPAAGHDQMWGLYMARLMLHGTHLYGPQLFESNPPLIIWLSAIPLALADALGLAATFVGKILILGLGVATASVSLPMVKRLVPGLSKSTLWVLAFVYLALFAVMPARDFGQRDHILALLCLPYILAAALDASGHTLPIWMATSIGLSAGLGIALKPHQALIPIAVESALLWFRPRRTLRSTLRPEPICIVLAGLLYLLSIQIFTADYFIRLLPILRISYWGMGHLNWIGLVEESIQLHVLAVLTLTAFFVAGWRKAPRLATLLLVAGIAATFAYYLQGTGWYYQQLPALSFFALALIVLALDAAPRLNLSLPSWAPNAAAALALLAVALTAHFTGYPFTPDRSFPIETPDPSFFNALPPGTPVATLTTTVDYTVPPVFKYNLTLAQRYPHLWMLPAILRGESGDPRISPSQLAQLEDTQHAAMREDFLHWQPQLVLIERCQDPAVHCQALEDRHDNLLAWFQRDPAFRDIFARYHYLRSSGPFDAYVPN